MRVSNNPHCDFLKATYSTRSCGPNAQQERAIAYCCEIRGFNERSGGDKRMSRGNKRMSVWRRSDRQRALVARRDNPHNRSVSGDNQTIAEGGGVKRPFTPDLRR
uniref:Uncharacterized protein n=1 Tax=Plectus sambesii TaxID=2011161 RepID=A0A914V6C7_9BILA